MNTTLIDLIKKIPGLKDTVNALRYHHDLGQQFAVWQDWRDLRRTASYLPDPGTISGQADGRHVLVVSLTQMLFQVKLEALLARVLRRAGAKVTVVTWRHCHWPKRYFRLFGIDHFVDFEDYLDAQTDHDLTGMRQSFFAQGTSLQAIKSWRYQNCRIGQQVLSTVGRMNYGMPNLKEPAERQNFGRLLDYNIRAIDAARAVIADHTPDILLFNEANGTNYGGFFDTAFDQGIEILQFVHPLRDDGLVFKRYNKESYGLHPNSLSRSTFEAVKDRPWTEQHEVCLWQEFADRYGGRWHLSRRNFAGTEQKSREDIFTQLRLDPAKKTAVLFSHVLWDANLFYGEDIFEDYEEWFVETVKAARANPSVNWLIKLHPANLWKRQREKVTAEFREMTLIRERVGALPPHVVVIPPTTDINTYSLFQLADYGITGRGTIGMELPCFGVPVFTAGTGRYAGYGFTIDSATRSEYLDRMARIQDYPSLTEAQTLLAKKHAYAVFNLRPLTFRSYTARYQPRARGAHPLDSNYTLRLPTAEAFDQAADLAQFRHWALSSDESDLMQAWLISLDEAGSAATVQPAGVTGDA